MPDEDIIKKKLKEKKLEDLKSKLQSPVTDSSVKRSDDLSNYLKKELAKDKKFEKKKQAGSLGANVSSLKDFVARGLFSSSRTVPVEAIKGLNRQEELQVRKLVKLLGTATRRYTKQEIFEALLLEKKSKKIAKAVVQSLFPYS